MKGQARWIFQMFLTRISYDIPPFFIKIVRGSLKFFLTVSFSVIITDEEQGTSTGGIHCIHPLFHVLHNSGILLGKQALLSVYF